MKITRRQFVTGGMFSLVGLMFMSSFFGRFLARAAQIAGRRFSRVRRGENLFMAFNNIRDPEAGESDEFTSIRKIHSLLSELQVPIGTTIIGIGARTGHPENPYGAPGEMGYLWKMGDIWNGKVTSPVDA